MTHFLVMVTDNLRRERPAAIYTDRETMLTDLVAGQHDCVTHTTARGGGIISTEWHWWPSSIWQFEEPQEEPEDVTDAIVKAWLSALYDTGDRHALPPIAEATLSLEDNCYWHRVLVENFDNA